MSPKTDPVFKYLQWFRREAWVANPSSFLPVDDLLEGDRSGESSGSLFNRLPA